MFSVLTFPAMLGHFPTLAKCFVTPLESESCVINIKKGRDDLILSESLDAVNNPV